MNFAAFVRSRLTSLGYGQKDLARAVQVTESYISQLLTRRKAPPGRDRTDIYTKAEAFLQLKPGELGRLVDMERTEEIRRKLDQSPEPLFREFRALVLRKCAPEIRTEVAEIFARQPFGILERLVTRKLLQVVQDIARKELDSQNWLRLGSLVGARSHEEMRVIVLEFLDTDVFQVSKESCTAFLDPLVESWSVELDSLRIDITLNGQLADDAHRTFQFVELEPTADSKPEPGFTEFIKDPPFRDPITEEEILFLRRQRFGSRRPNKLYYYRALQNLRDPIHFLDSDHSGRCSG